MPKKLSLSHTHTHTHTHADLDDGVTLLEVLLESLDLLGLAHRSHAPATGRFTVRGRRSTVARSASLGLAVLCWVFLWLCCSSKGWFAQGETVSQPYRRRESVPERDCVRMCAQHALPGVPARTMCAAQLAPHGSTLRWTCPLPGASAQPATPPCWLH